MQKELTEETKALVLAWPSPQDYNDAFQMTERSFADPELAAGQAELDRFGLPRPTSGMFASVYRLNCSAGSYAVRCFLQWKEDQDLRYQEIERTLKEANLPCTVGFEFQAQGIRIDKRGLPMLKMQWCEGECLNRWLQASLKDKNALENILEEWRTVLSQLRAAGIAHGDLQHGNIIVRDGKIFLVDYDGMYVPQFQGWTSNEIGHRNYQHPARTEYHFGPYLDNFSAWLIYLSILIAGCDPNVFYDFDGGDECLLFRKDDLENPLNSELFHVLEHHVNPQIRESSRTLRYLLSLEPEHVPGLDFAIEVPESLPMLNAVISDLPDWLCSDPANLDEETAAPPGSTILRRNRKRWVPLPESLKEGSVNGRWTYDQEGLVFAPAERGEQEASSSLVQKETPILHSPILGTFTSPAPYKRIGGQLHSPILHDLSTQENPENTYSISELKPLLKPLLALFTLGACIIAGNLLAFMPGPTEKIPEEPPQEKLQTWIDDMHYSLSQASSLEESGNIDGAITVCRRGLEELSTSKDKRALLSRGYLYFNLGKLESSRGDYVQGEKDLISSLKILEKIDPNSSECAGVLIDIGSIFSSQEKWEQAATSYKRALQAMDRNSIPKSEEVYQSTLKFLLEALNQIHKTKEIKQYKTLLLPEKKQDDAEDNNRPNAAADAPQKDR